MIIIIFLVVCLFICVLFAVAAPVAAPVAAAAAAAAAAAVAQHAGDDCSRCRGSGVSIEEEGQEKNPYLFRCC